MSDDSAQIEAYERLMKALDPEAWAKRQAEKEAAFASVSFPKTCPCCGTLFTAAPWPENRRPPAGYVDGLSEHDHHPED